MLPAHPESVVQSAHAGQLPALIAAWEGATDERAWLARALRVDLSLLTAHPHLALATLERRCAHGPAWYARAPEAPAAAIRAAELTAEWASTARGPALRAVRPPPVPLTGGVREEYRTSLAGELCTSPDGALIGVLGDDTMIRWERGSGRRADSAPRAGASGAWAPLLPPVAPPAWRLGPGNTWEHLELVHPDGSRIAIALGVELHALAVQPLADDLAVVGFDDVDGQRRYSLVDLAARRVAWTADGECRTAVRAGPRVLCAGPHGVTAHAAATGAVTAAFPAPDVEAIALLPDGAVVTRCGAVIRVWEPDALGGALGGTYGWTDARFSPDGARLVTGGNLCDARTGALLAQLQVNGPGWLLGGPPLPCQDLADDVFVEIHPFGLRVWDAHDGHLRVEDHGQRALVDDLVGFDPRGVHYAIARRRTGALEVRTLLGGNLVLQRVVQLAPRDALGFTPDGAALWWRAADGTRWLQPLASSAPPRPLAEGEPAPAIARPTAIAVRDGLLVVGELAAPCDEAEVIASPDGRAFAARRCHYVVAG